MKKGEYYSNMDLIECRPDFYFLSINSSVGGRKYGYLDTSQEVKMSEELLI